MTDPIRIVSKIRNNRLMETKEAMRMSSKEFASYLGISYASYLKFESLKQYPSEQMIRKICDKLETSQEWLFPQYMELVSQNTTTRTLSEEKMLPLSEAKLLTDNWDQQIVEKIELKELKVVSRKLMMELLTPREQCILTMRMEGSTLREVGARFSITAERVRYIESRAIRKLRNPKRAAKLKDFLTSRKDTHTLQKWSKDD